MADAGSKPATSTTSQNELNRSRPPQTSNHAVCGSFLQNSKSPQLVHNGLHRPPDCHNYVTNSSKADQLKSYGTPQCDRFRKLIFDRHKNIEDLLASGYASIARERDYVEANLKLARIDKELLIEDLNLSWDKDRIDAFAETKAFACTNIANRHQFNMDAFNLCKVVVEQYNITTPCPKDYQGDIYPCIKRMSDAKWWSRKLIQKQKKLLESTARDMGLVCQQKSAYSSTFARNDRFHQKQRNLHYLETTYIENDEGQRYSLKELYDVSVSNPKVRRAELMTRIKGFEVVAQQMGHVGEFYTITTPSRMHARLKKGRANPKYDGTTPDQAHKHLTTMFERIRAKLSREGLTIYGIRVVEPNHDGTPHWHLLIFMEPEIRNYVRSIFSDYALSVDGNEAGAKKHRFTAVAIDSNKGSAAGYVAKYVAKNIDGEDLEKDLYGNDAKQSAKGIDSWASTYNIRQFQFIGSPSVTVWRELRRLANSKQSHDIDLLKSPALYKAMLAADTADWAAYVMVMGGIGVKAKDRPIKSLYLKGESIDRDTGEINQEEITQYGEEKAPRVIGLFSKSLEVITHWRQWKIISALDKEYEELFDSLKEDINDNFLSEYQEFIDFDRSAYK